MARRLALVVVVLVMGSSITARATLDGYVRPVRGSIIQHFEPPPTPYTAGHRGIDIAVPSGTTVKASKAGFVAFAGQVGGALFVSIDHDDGLRSTYSFLSAVLVKKGEYVEQAQTIALSGGCHAGDPDPCLHFGIRRGDDYLDPEPFLLETMRRDLSTVLRLVPEAS